jgi:tetratricopeptide (TPR) repeat protein
MRLSLYIAVAAAIFCGEGAGQQSELAVGRAYYLEGDFKKAAVHFQLALKTNPNDAEFWYWMGMSYQGLATIAAPFEGRYSSRARIYLTRATELAPARQDYRRELFDFLLESAPSSRTALRQAGAVLLTIPEADPDYMYMRRRLTRVSRENSSVEARFGRLFLAAPRVALRVAELPASTLANRESLPRAGQ